MLDDFHAYLSSKLAIMLSWLAAAAGIGSFVGWVNVAVGVLSAMWLAVQIWNWWTYTRKVNQATLKKLMAEAKGLG